MLAKLEAMGELDNTYIIYTADHGMAIGRHGLQGKQNLYEHTWRVPLIVKGPGIKAGIARPGQHLPARRALHPLRSGRRRGAEDQPRARSFKPVLEGRAKTVRDVLYGVYCGGTKPGMRCVRKGDWKLIKYDVMDGTVRETQLFNLKDNPNEFIKQHGKGKQTNLAADPAHADKRREMEALLHAEMVRLDDPYRLWDLAAGNSPRRTDRSGDF